jgi:fructose-1,6-bisphosphatase/inositol monophosphatase family enzyme
MKIKCTTASSSKTTGALIVSGGVGVAGNLYANNVYGAVWNDYAEFRSQEEVIEPGYCAVSSNSGKLNKTNSRLQACDGIVSDTFGFSIGKTDSCKTPLAVAGRVLAYCEGDRYDYNAGDTVCATAGGLVSKMTREEIKEYPDRIVGTVSEIPEYDTWGSGNIKVNGRIWIKVK